MPMPLSELKKLTKEEFSKTIIKDLKRSVVIVQHAMDSYWIQNGLMEKAIENIIVNIVMYDSHSLSSWMIVIDIHHSWTAKIVTILNPIPFLK